LFDNQGRLNLSTIILTNAEKVNTKDNQERTPFSSTKEEGHTRITELLRDRRTKA